MVDSEIALEALGAICNAEVTVVDESDGPSIHGFGGVGGAQPFSIHQLVPRVLEADDRHFTGQLLQGTAECSNTIQIVKMAGAIAQDKTGQMKAKITIVENKLFDPAYDYDFTNLRDTETYRRGDEEYQRPYGYKRFALRILDKYDGNAWLGHSGRSTESVTGEWPVSYHGTKQECVDAIIKDHLKAGKGAVYGRGIYSTPSICEAESYATVFTSKKDGKNYRVILQNRINPAYRKICAYKAYWLIEVPEGTSDEKEEELVKRAIRPYGLLIKQVYTCMDPSIY